VLAAEPDEADGSGEEDGRARRRRRSATGGARALARGSDHSTHAAPRSTGWNRTWSSRLPSQLACQPSRGRRSVRNSAHDQVPPRGRTGRFGRRRRVAPSVVVSWAGVVVSRAKVVVSPARVVVSRAGVVVSGATCAFRNPSQVARFLCGPERVLLVPSACQRETHGAPVGRKAQPGCAIDRQPAADGARPGPGRAESARRRGVASLLRYSRPTCPPDRRDVSELMGQSPPERGRGVRKSWARLSAIER
jgi:hypothetical protein